MMTHCDRDARRTVFRKILCISVATLALAFAASTAPHTGSPAAEAEKQPGTSKDAAASCARKVEQLEDFSRRPGNRGSRTTRVSELEVNSYLAYELSPEYHPCLKSLVFRLEPARLQAIAIVDFDKLGLSSKNSVTKIIAALLTGAHTLALTGKLVADAGKAQFQLERALFDNTGLPNLLVEEIVSAIGRKQKPPFDPMQPSQMPFGIQKVDVGQGYIVVYQ